MSRLPVLLQAIPLPRQQGICMSRPDGWSKPGERVSDQCHESTTATVAGGPQQAPAGGLEAMLSFISQNKITEGRPIRSKMTDSSGVKTPGMKWIQPSGESKDCISFCNSQVSAPDRFVPTSCAEPSPINPWGYLHEDLDFKVHACTIVMTSSVYKACISNRALRLC